VLLGRPLLRFIEIRLFDRPKIERPLIRHEATQLDRNLVKLVGRQVRQILQPFRRWHIGHLRLMRQTAFGILK
jgi:hypothetical protein